MNIPCPFRRSAYMTRKLALDAARQLRIKLHVDFVVVPCESCKGFHIRRSDL